MADSPIKVSGSTDPVVSELGTLTQGLGHPLVSVEDDTPGVVANQFAFYPVFLTQKGKLKPGRSLNIGDVSTENTPLTADDDAELVKIVVSKGDLETLRLYVIKNGELVDAFYCDERKEQFIVDIPVSEGDTLSVRSAEDSSQSSDVVVMLIFKAKIER